MKPLPPDERGALKPPLEYARELPLKERGAEELGVAKLRGTLLKPAPPFKRKLCAPLFGAA